MTREQARKVKLSGDFLHSYLAVHRIRRPSSDRELVDLIEGNFLLANAIIGMLAPLRRRSVDEELDLLTPRDEGVPGHASATPLWATTVDLLRFARSNGWQQMPQPSNLNDGPTAFRNSFNLTVAITLEFAAQTRQLPAQVAKTFADAALADHLEPPLDRGSRGPDLPPLAAAWFG